MAEYGLIGEKLPHSYSKLIHEQLVPEKKYDLIPLTPDELKVFMEKKDFKGINVTIPYKQTVVPYLYSMDEGASSIGAVNTIVNNDGKLYGYNTDYTGFIHTLKKYNVEITGKKVLILGNGGAAKAVIAAVKSLSPAAVYIVKKNVTPGTISYEEAEKLHNDADVLINTSPVGMFPITDAAPVDLTPYTGLSAVVDIIYNPERTKLLLQAEKLGIKAVGGLDMLIAQAKYAAEFFHGIKIDDSEIERIYDSRHEWLK